MEFSFSVAVNQLSKLEDPVVSGSCHFRNLAWQIQVQPQLSDLGLLTTRSLGVYLRCNDERKSNTWCCYAVAEISLMPVRPDVEPHTTKLEHIFYSKENSSGDPTFLPWNYVLDIKNGYIKDDSITLEVHIELFEGGLAKAPAAVKLQEKKIEDTLKQLKSEQSKKETRDIGKATDTQNELAPSSEERIGKALEAELLQLTEDLSCSERARRAAEAERDELLYEITNCNSKALLLEDEKRRFEAKIATLEEELVEEQSSNERQNIELKAKLSELKITHRTEINNLEEQFESKAKEHLAQQKQSRNLVKKLKELQVQLEDERRHAHQYKDQVEKTNDQVKAVKRRLEETEEGMCRERGQKRKAQRELENMIESQESMTREVCDLKSKIGSNVGGTDWSSFHLGTSKRGSLQSGENGSGDIYTIEDEILDS